ncbi:MAG: hypothetical protein ACYCZP_14895 [Acidimicrobiales bacterium]
MARHEGIGNRQVAHDEGAGKEQGTRNKVMGMSPITRHQPLATSMVAGSFIRASDRSAADLRAEERRQVAAG